MTDDSTMGDRLRILRDRLSENRGHLVTQSELAKELGWTQARLSNYETGYRTLGASEISELYLRTFVSPLWLITGIGKMFDESITVGEFSEVLGSYAESRGETNYFPDTDTIPAKMGGRVPLISWNEAREWNYTIGGLLRNKTKDVNWILCPIERSDRAFALKVVDDDMVSSYGKSYPPGCIIFVDPKKAEHLGNGDRILAQISSADEVTFKSWVRYAGQILLKPLNESYPVIEEKFDVLGKVIAKLEVE